MLFSFFNPINYRGNITADIFRNYRAYFNRVIVNYKSKSYYINASVRPEVLSYELYGNDQFYWVLLMLNDVYDPYYGWIVSQEAAYQYAIQQYPEDQVIYHEDSEGEKYWNLVEDPNFPNHWYDKGDVKREYIQYVGALRAVDSLEAQTSKNEDLREIQIIDPADMNSFISDFIREMEKAL